MKQMQQLFYNVVRDGCEKVLRISVIDLEVCENGGTCHEHKEKERPRKEVSTGLLRKYQHS